MRLTRLTSPLSPLTDSAPSSSHTDPTLSSPLSQDYALQVKEYILNTMQRERAVQDGQWPAPYPYPPDDSPDNGGYPTQFPSPRRDNDATLAIVIPLIIVLTTLLFLIFLLIILLLRRRRGIELSDEGGPTNLEREDLVDGEGGFEGVEARWLEEVEEGTRIGYQRGKDWQTQYPPNSQPTEITLSQFLSIQEKGVSAWSFEPDYESNPALIVQSRTEITFLSDGFGMAPEEGGGCCVQSNLPLPKLNEVYYWECKMFEKPIGTNISIGLATKPYPSFRLPGWNRFSVGYHSSDGFKSHNFPFTSTSYGPPLLEGDTLGVGYRPRTGTVFFTRNGKKLEDAFIGFNKHNLFPTVGADSACSIHVNLGQAGFVFIEANVKKWGLAPMMGTLAPPPAYGSERGSILLESAGTSNPSPPTRRPPPSSSRLLPHAPPTNSTSSRSRHRNRRLDAPSTSSSLPPTAAGAASALASPSQPIRPSPLRHSRHASNLSTTSSTNALPSPSSHSPSHSAGSDHFQEDVDEEGIHNPPTPGLLDISLHSIHRFPNRPEDDSDSEERERSEEGSESGEEESLLEPERNLEQRLLREVARERGETESTRSVSPPAYHPIDPHMYAPGVAETILEDAFSSPSSTSHTHHSPRFSGTQPQASSSSGSFLAQLGFGSSASGSSPGSPAGRGYENRTGRGGVGNVSTVQSGGSEGQGSWFGWLNGNNQNST